VPTEEFKYPVERLPNAHCQDDYKEWTRCLIASHKGFPAKKKEEEPNEGQPFEELDLGNERDKSKWKTRSGRLRAQSGPEDIGFWRDYF
jgi:hypothetical protein